VHYADVKLLPILERVDPKPLGVEELLAATAVLEAGLPALGNRAAYLGDDRQLEWESGVWMRWDSTEGSCDSGGGGLCDAAKEQK
jgi:hypothetical protein